MSNKVKTITLSKEQSVLFHDEFLDFLKVLEFGAIKYSPNGWLRPDTKEAHFNHRDNTSSMFRHLAESYVGIGADRETGLDPLLHLACRSLMEYTRKRRGLQL